MISASFSVSMSIKIVISMLEIEFLANNMKTKGFRAYVDYKYLIETTYFEHFKWSLTLPAPSYLKI